MILPASASCPDSSVEAPRTLAPCSRPSLRGAAAVYGAIFLFLLLAIAGLGLDTARVRFAGQELQAAADAAALAGAELVLSDNEATQYAATRQAAVDIALANLANKNGVSLDLNLSNDPLGDVVIGRWDRNADTFTPTYNDPNAVQVRTRIDSSKPGGSLPLLFGNLMGTASSSISRNAIAQRGSGAGPAVILVLHPTTGKAFDMRGDAVLVANSGRIQVNSSDSQDALYLNGAPGNPRLRAGEVRVHGVSHYPTGGVDPVPIDGSDVVPDPLAGLPYPDTSAMPNWGGITAGGAYQPGYYPDGVNFNSGTATLNPGVYVFGAHGIELNGFAMMEGQEVMFFLENGARVVIAGNAPGMDVTAPSSGTYQGISIFAHRDSYLDFDISGSGVFEVVGTMYMARGHLEMDGNVDRRIGRIVIYTQQLRGNGQYNITGEGPPNDIAISNYLVQ